MRREKLIRITVLVALICAICTGCGSKNDTVATVYSLPVTSGTISQTLSFVGNVTSGQSTDLTWRTAGVISEVYVSLGDTVTAGQILAELTEDSLDAEALQASGDLIDAQDALEDVYDSETSKAQAYKDLRDKETALQEAKDHETSLDYPLTSQYEVDNYYYPEMLARKEEYEDALEEYETFSVYDYSDDMDDLKDAAYEELQDALNAYAEAYNDFLYYNGNISQNDRDQAAADVRVAQAEYDNALKTFQSYQQQYPRQQDINTALLNLETAQDTYNKRYIVAEFDGVVSNIDAKEGIYVEKGDTAFSINDMDALYLPLTVSELDISRVTEGLPAVILMDANTEHPYEGVVSLVDASGTTSGYQVSYDVRVSFVEPDDQIKIGMTGEVEITTESKEDVLLAPTNAIVTDNGKNYVTLVDNGNMKRTVEVTVGLSNDEVTEISGENISEGTEIEVPTIDTDILDAMGLDYSYLPEDYYSGTIPAGMSLPVGVGAGVSSPEGAVEAAPAIPENAEGNTTESERPAMGESPEGDISSGGMTPPDGADASLASAAVNTTK